MKKIGNFKILVFFFLLYFVVSNFEVSAGVDFEYLNGSDLITGIGARAIGLGGAFVSVADDASAVYWNPAGLTQLKKMSYSFPQIYPMNPVQQYLHINRAFLYLKNLILQWASALLID